jgi:hypothetical protein
MGAPKPQVRRARSEEVTCVLAFSALSKPENARNVPVKVGSLLADVG